MCCVSETPLSDFERTVHASEAKYVCGRVTQSPLQPLGTKRRVPFPNPSLCFNPTESQALWFIDPDNLQSTEMGEK